MAETKRNKSAMRNPYTPFKPAIEYFVGRESIWKDSFEKHVKGEGGFGEHLLFFGPAGIGKTSLLRKLERQALLEVGVPALYIDFGDPETNVVTAIEAMRRTLPMDTADTFLSPWRGQFNLPENAGRREILREMYKRLARGISISFPGGISFDPKALLDEVSLKDGLVALRQEILTAIESSRKHRTVIILDQVGLLAESLQGQEGSARRYFLEQFLEIFEETSGTNILFVLGIRSERLGNLLGVMRFLMDPAHVIPYPLGPLTREEAQELIRVPVFSDEKRILFSTPVIDDLVDSSGTNPSSLQLSCYFFWEGLNERDVIRPHMKIHLETSEIAKILSGRLEDRYWEYLSLPQRETLQLIAQYQPVRRSQLNSLAEEKEISQLGDILQQLLNDSLRPLRYFAKSDEYVIAHDLLSEYILSQVPDEERDLTLLRKILAEAPRLFQAFGRLLAEQELDKLWLLKDKIRFEDRIIPVIIVSELEREKPAVLNWGRVFPEQTVAVLEKKVADDEKTTDKKQIAAWLGQIPASTKHVLLTKLITDDNQEVRRNAAIALASSNHPSSPNVLLAALKDESNTVRASAAKSLGVLGCEKAVEILCHLIYDDVTDVIEKAGLALAEIGNDEAIECLIQALGHEKKQTRQIACWGLGNAKAENAIEVLANTLLNDSDEDVRVWAASSLGDIASPLSIDHLNEALSDPSNRVYTAVVEALLTIEDSYEAWQILLAQLDSEDPYRRWLISNHIKQSPLDKVNEYFDGADRLISVQGEIEIMRVLVYRKGKAALPFLIKCLNHKQEEIRQVAVQAIGLVGGKVAENKLIHLLFDDSSPRVRREIVKTLSRLSSGRSEILEAVAVEDENKFVSFEARRTIKKNKPVGEINDSGEVGNPNETQIYIDELVAQAMELVYSNGIENALAEMLESEQIERQLSAVLLILNNPDITLLDVSEQRWLMLLGKKISREEEKGFTRTLSIARWSVTSLIQDVFYIFSEEAWSNRELSKWLLTGLQHDAWMVRRVSLLALWKSRQPDIYEGFPNALAVNEEGHPERYEMNRLDVIALENSLGEPGTSLIYKKQLWDEERDYALRRLKKHYKIY